MHPLLEIALVNAGLATLLALIVVIVTRVLRSPALAHVLWLLVLVKLVTPPLVTLPWESIAWFEAETSEVHPPLAQIDPAMNLRVESEATDRSLAFTGFRGEVGEISSGLILQIAVLVWITGSILWCAVVLRRVIRFQRLLSATEIAPERMQAELQRLAGRIGVHRVPKVRLVDSAMPPLLWGIGGRLTILLPRDLLNQLSEEQQRSLMLHELVHIRRRDHWVRVFELLMLCLYWWHPVVWYARRKLNEAEEQCCDAWVVSEFPSHAKSYARALFETIEFVSRGCPSLPPIASGFGYAHSLHRRLDMILHGGVSKSLSSPGRMAAVIAVALALPWSIAIGEDTKEAGELPKLEGSAQTTEKADKPDEKTAHKPKQQTARLVFQPTAEVGQGAAWSELFHLGGDKKTLTALISAHLGDKFPVQKGGKTLFELRLAAGNDERLVVESFVGEKKSRHVLIRDKPIELEVEGKKYTVSYGTSQVAADKPLVFHGKKYAVTYESSQDAGDEPLVFVDHVTIIVSHRLPE